MCLLDMVGILRAQNLEQMFLLRMGCMMCDYELKMFLVHIV